MKDGASWPPSVAVCGMDEYRVVIETPAAPEFREIHRAMSLLTSHFARRLLLDGLSLWQCGRLDCALRRY
jgi:hypothetical protein